MLSFFPLDVLDEIWDVIGSVSEGFLTYSCTLTSNCSNGIHVCCCFRFLDVLFASEGSSSRIYFGILMPMTVS